MIIRERESTKYTYVQYLGSTYENLHINRMHKHNFVSSVSNVKLL